ncbi:MAG: hypothetical protein KF888_13105, partial [Nitrosomonas sp.]|nr:hypothetical protein [Nitrosomonas sp.]
MNDLICMSAARRVEIRKQTVLYGLDYVEVGSDQCTLTVYCLGRAPDSLDASNVVIEGGRRIQGVRVTRVSIERNEAAGLDDAMEIVTDKAGD